MYCGAVISCLHWYCFYTLEALYKRVAQNGECGFVALAHWFLGLRFNCEWVNGFPVFVYAEIEVWAC